MNHRDDMRDSIKKDVEQHKQARLNPATLFGFLVYGGTLGLLLVLPMVGGAYLGLWLDSLQEEYGSRWTVSLIIIGVVAGLWNVYWYVREHS